MNRSLLAAVFISILLFVWPKTKDTEGQFMRPKAIKSNLQHLQQIEKEQQRVIAENKDSLSSVMAPILAGEVKPKTVVKYRWRTRIKEVHDTVYALKPADDTADDYFIADKDPCPDTVYVTVPAEKKKTLLQRIFKHKN